MSWSIPDLLNRTSSTAHMKPAHVIGMYLWFMLLLTPVPVLSGKLASKSVFDYVIRI